MHKKVREGEWTSDVNFKMLVIDSTTQCGSQMTDCLNVRIQTK